MYDRAQSSLKQEREAIEDGVRYSRWIDFVDTLAHADQEIIGAYRVVDTRLAFHIRGTVFSAYPSMLINLLIPENDPDYSFLRRAGSPEPTQEESAEASLLLQDSKLRKDVLDYALWEHLHGEIFEAGYNYQKEIDMGKEPDRTALTAPLVAFAQKYHLITQPSLDPKNPKPTIDYGKSSHIVNAAFDIACESSKRATDEVSRSWKNHLIQREVKSPNYQEWERRPNKPAREEYIRALHDGTVSLFHDEWKTLEHLFTRYDNAAVAKPDVSVRQFVGYVNRQMMISELNETGQTQYRQYWPVNEGQRHLTDAGAMCWGAHYEQAKRLVTIRGVLEDIYDTSLNIASSKKGSVDMGALIDTYAEKMETAINQAGGPRPDAEQLDAAVKIAFDEALHTIKAVQGNSVKLG